MHQLWSEKTCRCYCCCCCRRRYCLVLLFEPLLLSFLMVFQFFSIVVAVIFVFVVVDVVVSVFDTYTLIRDCYSPMGHKEAQIYHNKACCFRLPWARGIFSHFESWTNMVSNHIVTNKLRWFSLPHYQTYGCEFHISASTLSHLLPAHFSSKD